MTRYFGHNLDSRRRDSTRAVAFRETDRQLTVVLSTAKGRRRDDLVSSRGHLRIAANFHHSASN